MEEGREQTDFQGPNGPALALRPHVVQVNELPQQGGSNPQAQDSHPERASDDVNASIMPMRASQPLPSQTVDRNAMLPIGLNAQQVQLAREIERSRIHFIGSEFNEGDTLVFLDCPDCPRDYRRPADCRGMAYQSQQLRVHSEKLLKTGSSKFAEMLSPTYQFRVQRRRRMVNKMPDGIKFLLDLTPPNEGDELVFQMTELSLTPGLIKWWTSSSIHKIDSALVAGHDDVCYCSLNASEPQHDSIVPYQLDEPEVLPDHQTPGQTTTVNQNPFCEPAVDPKPQALNRGARISPFKLSQMKIDGEDKLFSTPAFRDIPDYCPFRHRNSIIRLLLLIEGKHVMLDSATRLWTLVGVAKILDCPSLLRGQVTQWIMHGNNVRFIEVLPEEALKLGYTLQIPEVTQSAFRILVNELALEDAATPGASPASTHVTVFGRRRGDVGDELSNLVQHAARELVERVTNQHRGLQDPCFLDSTDYAPWRAILQLEEKLQKELDKTEAVSALYSLQQLIKALRDIVPIILGRVERTRIVYCPTLHTGIDFDRATYVEPKDFTSLEKIMEGFNFIQKLLCPIVYHQITEEMEHMFRFAELFKCFPSPYFKQMDVLTTSAQRALQRLIDAHPGILAGADLDDLFYENHDRDPGLGGRWMVRSPMIDAYKMGECIQKALQPFLNSWVRHDIDPYLNITRHMLLALNHNEMKFLPLWAGGCNDGTGGVFERYLPFAELGPNGPGPGFHTGLTVPSAPSSISGTITEDLGGMRIMGSTTASSIDVHDSISTVYRPDRVIVDDVSIRSEAFTETETGFQDARFAVPAPGQANSQALEMMCDMSTDDDSRSVRTDVQPVVAEGSSTRLGNSIGRERDEKDNDTDVDDAASFSWDDCGSDDDMEIV